MPVGLTTRLSASALISEQAKRYTIEPPPPALTGVCQQSVLCGPAGPVRSPHPGVAGGQQVREMAARVGRAVLAARVAAGPRRPPTSDAARRRSDTDRDAAHNGEKIANTSFVRTTRFRLRFGPPAIGIANTLTVYKVYNPNNVQTVYFVPIVEVWYECSYIR